MVLMTMIARVADALPLAASMQEDEQVITGSCGKVENLKIFYIFLMKCNDQIYVFSMSIQ